MKKFLVVLTILAVSLAGGSAFAASMKVDDDTFGRFGTKAIIRYQMTNPDATADKVDVVVPNARVYFSGQVTNTFKFGLNFDMSRGVAGAQGQSLSDAFIMLDFLKELKVMSGIYRMAVSRVALQDTYQYILPSSPDVAASGYLSRGQAGFRSAGLTVWGDVLDGKLRYNVGLWDGDMAAPIALDMDPATAGNQFGTNGPDSLGMSARVVFNFLDPEKGYVCPGCYLGKAQVFNVGVGYLTQDYIIGGAEKTYTVTTVDAFYDANGLTGELGFFQYEFDNAASTKSKGIYAQAAYVIADKIQPALRFETWDNDTVATADWAQVTAGVNYLFDGHDAKVGVELKRRQPEVGADIDTVTVQLQVQF